MEVQSPQAERTARDGTRCDQERIETDAPNGESRTVSDALELPAPAKSPRSAQVVEYSGLEERPLCPLLELRDPLGDGSPTSNPGRCDSPRQSPDEREPMTASVDWLSELQAARAPVEEWIQGVASDAWLAPRAKPWTRKDLLGHLAAWSDFLLDQVEALQRNQPDTIESIDVDAWNALEVERRRDWTVEATIATWRRTGRRADEVISALPPEAWDRRWRVAWAEEPVSIGDVLRLIVVHLGQHRAELERGA